MLHDYFNGCARAPSLGIAAQIKKWLPMFGFSSLVFAGLLFHINAIIFWLPLEKYKIILWKKKKSLKTSKISSFYFRFYFVIARDSLCI
jgi:hypothetical protein